MFNRGVFMEMNKSRKGQTRLMEIGLAAIVMLFGFIMIGTLNKAVVSTSFTRTLESIAHRTLTTLDKNELLYELVYGEDGRGNPEYAKLILRSMIPYNLGFNFTVCSRRGEQVEQIWSVAERYDPKSSAGTTFIYLAYRGEENARIVLLSISGETG